MEYIVFSCLVLLGPGYLLWNRTTAAPSVAAKSKSQKRDEIIHSYQRRMQTALAKHADDPEALLKIKTRLLKDFSAELSRNIFLDEDEVREIVRELAHFDGKTANA